MWLICPVRPGDSNEELRYALRSWETNLILPGGLNLLTVGYKPTWLNPDEHLDGNHYKSMPQAVFDNIRRGAEWASGEPEVVFMNDDFFCMDPVGAILPVRRDCSLTQHAGVFPSGASTWWPRSLRLTLSWLREQGYPDPHSYEVHRPLIADPIGMAEALYRWMGADDGLDGDVPQWRTIYGVLNEIEAHPVTDAKLGIRAPGFGTPWVSTSDQSWRRYAGPIRKRFQKPSRWEV